MSTAAWLAWSVLVVAVVIDMITVVLEQRRVTRIVDEVDDLNDVVFNVREAIVDLQAYERPSTGRHAHSGEIRTSYVRVD